MRVGTKQLKNQLSRYLRQVRAGETVTVTDRGRVVAELRGVDPMPSSEDASLRDMDTAGLITTGSGRFGAVRPVRLRRGRSASKAIAVDRG